ncbi:unnamed protein product [Ectocarpus sp. 6 AP-2014]
MVVSGIAARCDAESSGLGDQTTTQAGPRPHPTTVNHLLLTVKPGLTADVQHFQKEAVLSTGMQRGSLWAGHE